MLDGGGGADMFIRFIDEAAEGSMVRLVWSVAGERSVERLGGSFLNILKSKNI